MVRTRAARAQGLSRRSLISHKSKRGKETSAPHGSRCAKFVKGLARRQLAAAGARSCRDLHAGAHGARIDCRLGLQGNARSHRVGGGAETACRGSRPVAGAVHAGSGAAAPAAHPGTELHRGTGSRNRPQCQCRTRQCPAWVTGVCHSVRRTGDSHAGLGRQPHLLQICRRRHHRGQAAPHPRARCGCLAAHGHPAERGPRRRTASRSQPGRCTQAVHARVRTEQVAQHGHGVAGGALQLADEAAQVLAGHGLEFLDEIGL